MLATSEILEVAYTSLEQKPPFHRDELGGGQTDGHVMDLGRC